MPSAFPSRPVRYVVPFRPGGPPDAIARIIAGGLSSLWQQPVVIDNRPGVNGNVGSEFVVSSPPDGHTLLQGTSATHGSNAALFPLLGFDPFKDLAPVIPLIEGPMFLAAGARQPFARSTICSTMPERSRVRFVSRPLDRARPSTSRENCSAFAPRSTSFRFTMWVPPMR